MKTRRLKSTVLLSMVLWLTGIASLAAASEQKTPQAENPPVAGEISGAGAHFSWIIFNELKPGLEKKYKRPLKLYGRESMLGAGCNAGIKHAKESTPEHEQFGFVCCPLDEDEVKSNGLTVHPIATEPIVILVNAANPVNGLSTRQVRDIFQGKIRNWIEVGGSDEPIVVVMRPHCKHRPGHWKTILPSVDLFRKDRMSVKSAAEMVKRVTAFKGGFGHTGSTWAFTEVDKVKIIKVDGYMPNAENLRSKKYPFYRQLSAVTHGAISKDLAGILHEVQTSDDFKRIALKYGLLPSK